MPPLKTRYPADDGQVIVGAQFGGRGASQCIMPGIRSPLQVARWGFTVVALGIAAGCTKGPITGGLDPAPTQSGAVAVAVAGLPAGASAALTLTGPSGFSRTVTGPETITGLTPGSYTLAATDVGPDGDTYVAAPATQGLTIQSSATTNAAVTYTITTGRLAVLVDGLGSGPAEVLVTGPAGFSRTVTRSDTLRGLATGNYLVKPAAVLIDGDRFAPTTDSSLVLVTPGMAPSPTAFLYLLASGRLDLTVDALPGITPSVAIDGPNGFSLAVTSSQLLKGLPPGAYQIHGGDQTTGGDVYAAVAAPSGVQIPLSLAPVPAAVSYQIKTGALSLTVTGLPGGVAAPVTVTGPGGYSHPVAATETIRGLVPGTYTVVGGTVTTGGATYAPQPASQTAGITAAKQPVSRSVNFGQVSGSLAVTVDGLPGGTNGAITVTGPNGFSKPVTGTTTLTGLVTGSYTVAAQPVSAGGQSYQPSPLSQTISVPANGSASASVAYAGVLGNLTVSISGLPGGVSGSVTVAGPGGFNQSLTATHTLTFLVGGTYTISAASVSSGGVTYTAAPPSQSATVSAGTTTSKSVTYTATGSLAVTVSGMPGGINAAITVTGPAGFNQNVTASATLAGLAAGSYTVSAGSVTSGGSTYTPSPVTQTPNVTSGSIAAVAVTYTAGPVATLNLVIDGMYLTQAAANYNGTTPLITGRDAYLRVFVKANQANAAAPTVRVRIYSGAALIQTTTIVAPGASVPTAITEGTFASSWNLLIPAVTVQPNLKILADVDPTNAVAESNDADNTFPVSGTPFALDVRTVPTWQARFVPVLQTANGLQGNVTAGNMAQFLVDPLKLLPVATYNADVRAVYTTKAPALVSDNANGAWGTILNEILALRSADASVRYYYGVVSTSYGSGVAGMGYVGGGFQTAIGWDHLPSGSGVMAHEVGHNMGRQHSPCGGAASPDPSYPYVGGQLGIYGLDLTTLAVKPPTTTFDFMSYCNPAWVSDYTWTGLITYRQSNPNFAPPAPSNAVSGLLVWGRITSAGVILEPAFRVAAPATMPAGGDGTYRVEGLAADGSVLFSYPVQVQHTMTINTEHEMHFATVLPLDQAQDQGLARLRFVGAGSPVDRLSLQAIMQNARRVLLRNPGAAVTAPNAAQATITWDGATYPMAMVRDAATGEVLSFARGGSATLWTRSRRFDVTFSDGVRSVVARVQ